MRIDFRRRSIQYGCVSVVVVGSAFVAAVAGAWAVFGCALVVLVCWCSIPTVLAYRASARVRVRLERAVADLDRRYGERWQQAAQRIDRHEKWIAEQFEQHRSATVAQDGLVVGMLDRLSESLVAEIEQQSASTAEAADQHRRRLEILATQVGDVLGGISVHERLMIDRVDYIEAALRDLGRVVVDRMDPGVPVPGRRSDRS